MKKIGLAFLGILGALATAGAGLSGAVAYLFIGGRGAFEDPIIIWYAPLFLTPVALVGLVMIGAASLVSKTRRRLLGWSVLVVVLLLVATAAVFNLSGLSTGEIELEGTLWGTVAVVASVAYATSLLLPACVGVLVAKDVLTKTPEAT